MGLRRLESLRRTRASPAHFPRRGRKPTPRRGRKPRRARRSSATPCRELTAAHPARSTLFLNSQRSPASVTEVQHPNSSPYPLSRAARAVRNALKCKRLSGARNLPDSGAENREFPVPRPLSSQLPPQAGRPAPIVRRRFSNRSRRGPRTRSGLPSMRAGIMYARALQRRIE